MEGELVVLFEWCSNGVWYSRTIWDDFCAYCNFDTSMLMWYYDLSLATINSVGSQLSWSLIKFQNLQGCHMKCNKLLFARLKGRTQGRFHFSPVWAASRSKVISGTVLAGTANSPLSQDEGTHAHAWECTTT